MKIRILQGCAGVGFAYGKGGVYDVPEERAKDLIRGGLAAPYLDIETPEGKKKQAIETAVIDAGAIERSKKKGTKETRKK